LAREITFNFPCTHGLHARPASLIQEIAGRFNSAISWENKRTNSRADGKSVLALIALDTREKDPCRITIQGTDEEEAEAALKTLVENELPGWEEKLPAIRVPAVQEITLPRVFKKENPLFFNGTGAGSGIARAKTLIFASFTLEPPPGTAKPHRSADEIQAVGSAINHLEQQLISSIAASQDQTEKDILTAHLSIIRDKTFRDKINEYIIRQKSSAARAVYRTALYFGAILQKSRSLYIRQRLADINDLSTRILSLIPNHRAASPPAEVELSEPVILVAADLLPSRLIALDKKYLKGLVLAEAAGTSHTVILARAFAIPTVTGIEGIHKKLHPGEEAIIDGRRGLVVPGPGPALSRFYDREIKKQRLIKEKAKASILPTGVSAAGEKIEVAANISSVEELEPAFLNGAEGIGLFRTELLFMNRTAPPCEEEQFAIYSRAAQAAGNLPVIIRTLDIGGDKPIPYLNLPQEANPFLGYRGVRIYGDFNSLINDQLRALLRASALGNLKIMFPMVACVEEIRSLKNRLQAAALELENEGIPCNPGLPVGMMVEIPAAAFSIDKLSDEVDFFSVGSNDLCQYFLAADRANPKVGDLYNPLSPAFLRLLKKIIDDAHARNKWVGLCGEMAGQHHYLPVLVGLGFDEISLAAPNIPFVKSTLTNFQFAELKALTCELLEKTTAAEIAERLTRFSHSPTDAGLVSEELINLDSESASKDEAIRELTDLLELTGRIENSDDLEAAIWSREDVYSTGIGFGVAIPHCQSPRNMNNSIAFLRLKNPIDWQSLDGQPVDMVFLLSIRASDRDIEHMKILARLSRQLMDEEFRAGLRNAKKPCDLVTLINQCT
jgi:phosphoenolpyruvate-protein phosphotransferase